MDKFRNLKLTKFEFNQVQDFIHKRYFRKECLDVQFQSDNELNTEEFKIKYNLVEEKRPIWAIFTHINWDAVSDCNPMLFNTFDEWFEFTIQKIKPIKNVLWLIKIHPHELSDNKK